MTAASVFVGGRVFTGRRYEESLLVEDGKVVFVGPRDQALREAPTGVDRQDLGGALIVPGLVDAHLHVAEVTRVRTGLDLSAASSVEDLGDRLATWAAAHPHGPIVGRGWNPEKFRARRPPTVREIDRAVPDRPTVLYDASGHAAVLNSIALEMCGLLTDPPPVPAAMLGRFPDGALSGLVYEDALARLGPVVTEQSGPTPDDLRATLAGLSSFGITSIGAMSVGPAEARGLRALASAGALPLHVRAYARLSQLDRWAPEDRTSSFPRFSLVGVKAFLDGAFGPRTAALGSPYEDDRSNSGQDRGDDSTLADELDAAAEQGLAPALHAIGDRAVERACRLLTPWSDRPGLPARIEHASLTPPELLDPLVRARPTLVVQPGFVWSDSWLADRLGPARARWAYVFRTLIDRGLRLAASSDAPYDPVDPWRGLRAAVHRRDELGRSANPTGGEALPVEEALGLYTEGAASALGMPERGRLVPGAPADFVVLTVPDLSLVLGPGDPPVRETWVDGARVFGPRSPERQ